MAQWLTRTDVVAVTGGSNGLGAQLIRALTLDGLAVVSLDVQPPPPVNHVDGVLYLQCDVSDFENLTNCRQIIDRELGTVTVLINNAGVRKPWAPLNETSVEDIHATLDINLAGVFMATKTFLPGMLRRERGYIVTVASALGFVSPAGLAVYGASKAGLLGLYEALTFEHKDKPWMHTLLVCPGQLDTKMFSEVKTPSKVLAPVVSHSQLALRIIEYIRNERHGVLYTPLYVGFLPLMRAMPLPIFRLFRLLAGVDKVLDQASKEQHLRRTESLVGLSPSDFESEESASLK